MKLHQHLLSTAISGLLAAGGRVVKVKDPSPDKSGQAKTSRVGGKS